MTCGSLDTNRGEPSGVRLPARCWLVFLVCLATLAYMASDAETASPDVDRSPAQPNPVTDLFGSSLKSEHSASGMIGPVGTDGDPTVDEPKMSLLAQYAAGSKSIPETPVWPPPQKTPELPPPQAQKPSLDVELQSIVPSEDEFLVAPRHHGPLRRWARGALNVPWAVPTVGRPLRRCDWRFRPLSIGWFAGSMWGGLLMDDWVDQGSGYFGGYRIGWDFDPYWGCQTRLAFGYAELVDSERAIAAQEAADAKLGLSPSDPFLSRFDRRRDSDLFLWDVGLLYYPLGDANWRPYLLAGMGVARVDFLDRLSVRRAETVFEVPLGVGVRLRWCDWLASRFELTDSVVFGDNFNTVHDLSFTGGVEILLGGTRKAYWPWNPSRHYW